MRFLYIILLSFFIVSCGGGGGGSGGDTSPSTPTPTPSIDISADPASVLLGNTSTLTWSSTNTSSCSASWTSSTATSGSEIVTISSAGNNSFSITCTGAGGNRSASVTVAGYRNTEGVVVDGYISGADVFIDENDNWMADSTESSTTSDNDGKFTIKYANGNLVSLGGTDIDSQTLLDNFLITHKLSGHSDFKAVTPITSIAAFMEDSSAVNIALGIDSSIDIFTFDPVDNKGDGGINDYLYEKGNQLTVLAFALQNITNNLNTSTETTQDYFKAITEEIEKEYTETSTKVDIETKLFVTKVLDNIVAAKSVSIDETAKLNTVNVLAGMMPIIQVKSEDNLTTAIIRFAVSTLQTDIQAIANGTASTKTVTSYTEDLLNYIAEDQNIDASKIAPNITAIADSASTSEDTEVEINTLLNDSYVTSSPFSLSATNGNNGSTLISNNLITYLPDADYNGNDSFSYTITQVDKTSSADVTVTIEAVNDSPSIDIASNIQVEENQTTVTTVSVSDVDGDELTLSLDGTDAESFNLSNDNVLTFKEAPDYETKSSYSISLSLTDGVETVTKDITITILNVNYIFTGKVIDGYIEGAEIYIDQNFNFVKDDGEFYTNSSSNGSFNIGISDESLAACLENRPIIADVPVGAIDSSLGEVSNAYQMILPSIKDSVDANATIYVTPFTTLLGDAVVQGINASNIDDEISVSEGCGDIANAVALNISNELLQITNSIESSLGISFDDLLMDFIQDNSSSIISETSAQKIAAFFPYFKELSDEFDSELTNIHGETINTNVIIEEDAINSILSSNDIEEMPLSFNAIYKTEPNDLGWFIQEKIIANGAKVNQDGQLKHYKCFTNSENCITSSRTLDALRNASKRYTRTSTFLNNSYDPENYNYQLVIEDEQRVDFDINGNPKDRVCIYQNWLYLTPVNTKENFNTNDRYNTGVSDGSNDNDNCSDVLANKDEALFVALVDQYDDGTDFEEIDIRITNPIYQNSTFFENKVNNIYQNRNTLDLDPLIQEFASIPRDFKDIEVLRSKLTESSTDQISIFWTKRNASGQLLETAKIDIKFDKNNDYFEYGTHENSSTGSEYTIVSSTEGQQSINDIVNVLYSNSNVFNSSTYLSYAPIFSSESTFSADENQTAIGTVTAVDGDDDDITFSISGDDITISAEGILTFNTAPDYETKTTYTAIVTASDGTNSTTQNIIVNITNLNDNDPEITSLASFNSDENQTEIGVVSATDADGDAIAFSISGSEINIDSSSGVLKFVSAPDYETNTSYSATVTVSDGSNSTTQDITVTINNLNDESPVFTSESTFNVEENQKAIGTVTATDKDGDDITLTISSDEIEISTTGVLTFISTPDYETKSSYSATVTASDGTNQTKQDITVTIIDVAEAEADAPVYSDFTLDVSSVDVSDTSATVTATFRVTDESGVSDRYLNYNCYLNFSNRFIYADNPTERVSGDDKDGTYQCIFTITTSAIPGTYRFNASSMGDVWGNITGSSLAPSDITLTISNSNVEADAPVYSDFTLDVSSVDVSDTSATVTATFRVTDESGVSDRYLSYNCYLNFSNRFIYADNPTERVSGDDKDGTYQCIFTITTSAIPGTYRFNASSMGDVWGNITGSSLAPSDITLTISNSNVEADAPVYSDFTLSDSELNASTGPHTVTATFRVTDESGVSDRYLSYNCYLNFSNRFIYADNPTERVSGDDKDGTYQCIFTITTSAIPGTYRFNASSMGDVWGNITGSSLAPSDITLTISNNNTDTAYYLYGDSSQSTYLGCYDCGSDNAESICNESVTYGSSVGTSSIWNSVGTYGSTVGTNSPWNSVGANPPEFFNNKEKTSSYGKFTINTATANRTNITKLTNILDFFNNSSSNHSATRNYACSSSQTSINVTVAANDNGSGNVYVINGEQKSSLTLERGKSYTFVHPSGHPFRFSETENGTHSSGQEYTNDVAKSSGSTIIAVSSSTPSTLYYYCSIHSGMGGTITVN